MKTIYNKKLTKKECNEFAKNIKNYYANLDESEYNANGLYLCCAYIDADYQLQFCMRAKSQSCPETLFYNLEIARVDFDIDFILSENLDSCTNYIYDEVVNMINNYIVIKKIDKLDFDNRTDYSITRINNNKICVTTKSLYSNFTETKLYYKLNKNLSNETILHAFYKYNSDVFENILQDNGISLYRSVEL